MSSSEHLSFSSSRQNIPTTVPPHTGSTAVRSLDPLILDTLDSSTILVVNKVDTLCQKVPHSSMHVSGNETLKSTANDDVCTGETFSRNEILDRLKEKCQDKVQIECGKNVWMLSCTSGEGLQQFLDGFAGVLKDR